MRVHRVEITAFGPFRDTVSVDFDAFDDDGLFLIAGRTGSGKTSILDAVTFALYGRAPRYDGGTDSRYRCDYAAEDAEPKVTLEFSAGGSRYWIERVPAHERLAARGERRLVAKQMTVTLYEHDGQGWVGVASHAREVGERITNEIVQLTADQFLQVILLAQNRFQEFLVADSAQRREVLRKIFRTQRFASYAEELKARTVALQGKVRDARKDIENHSTALADRTGTEAAGPDDAAGLRAWIAATTEQEEDRVAAAVAAEKNAAEASRLASAEAARQQTVRRDQDRRDAAVLERSAALAQAEEIAEISRAIDDARRAEATWPAVRSHQEAAERSERASAALAQAEAAYARVHTAGRFPFSAADADLAKLVATAADLQTDIGALSGALNTEQRLSELKRAASKARAAVTDHETKRQRLTERLTQEAANLEQLATRVEELRAPAADVEPARLHLAATTQACDAALSAIRAQMSVDDALAALEARAAELARAEGHRATVWQLRLDGFAASLAAELVDGQPCAVCGSLDHPAPAEATAETVTEAMIKTAERAVTAAREAVVAAEDVVAGAREALTVLVTQSGGKRLADLKTEQRTAATRLRVAEEAVTALAAATAETEAANQRHSQIAADITKHNAARDGLLTSSIQADEAATSASRTVEDARGEFATVRERVEQLTSDRRVLDEIITARREAAEAAEGADRAAAVLTVALTEQGFSDAADVAPRRLAKADLAAREARVAAHERALAGAERVLADPDLADLPAEPVDVASAIAAADQARDAAIAATRAAAHATSRQRAAMVSAGAIETALAATGNVTKELGVLERLFASVNGDPPNDMRMKLEDFVLAAKLEEIVQAANVRLQTMTEGRYELQYSDALQKHGKQSGLSIEVMDQHTGAARPTASLSGGEKFLASLALALGLAETVTAQAGGITLDTLFIDEGFGSLDAETLETAMETLDTLRAGGRTIGVISHVAEMHDRIPAKVEVEVVEGGWSVARQ